MNEQSFFPVSALAVALTLLLSAAAPAAVTYDTIALSGATGTALGLGPDQGSGVDFSGSFSTPVLSASGDVAFLGLITGTGVDLSNDTGIWQRADGTLAAVARTGSDGPGPNLGAGIHFSQLSTPLLNAVGELAFHGVVSGTGVNLNNDRGIWTNAGGSLAPVAREGTDGPTGPGLGTGVHFASVADARLNSAGHVAFQAVLTGSGVNSSNERGVWTNAGGALAAVSREGNTAALGPGVGAGISFSNYGGVVLNGAGEVAFRGTLTGTGVSSSNDTGIWTNVGGTLAVLAREGSEGPGPGLGAGVNFNTFFFNPAINSAGMVAFRGSLIGTGVDGSNNSGIWLHSGGSLAVVARTGADGPGPDLGAGVNFSGFSDPVLNAAGNVAFVGSLTGTGVDATNSGGVWTITGGVLAAVARSGNDGPGPGLGAGVNFTSFSFRDLVMNAAGEVAFLAGITGTGVNDTNDLGLWTNVGGTLTLVVREGDLFDVDPTIGVDLRTISGIAFASGFVSATGSGGEDGLPRSFNDSGLLTFGLTFTDGSSGIFTALVPEPASVALLGLTAPLLLRRRKRCVRMAIRPQVAEALA